MLLTFGVSNAQTSEIFKNLNDDKELFYPSVREGCLTITKNSIKESYSDNCVKPIDFTIHNMSLKDNKIRLSLTMHYFGDTKLVGFLEIKDNLLVLSYGDSEDDFEDWQSVGKYKLK